MGRERVRQSRRWVRRATGLVVVWVALTLPLAAARAAPPGVRLDFDQLLEREELRQHGMLLVIGPSARLRAESFDGEVLRQELQYSPTTGLVFDVRAPGFLPGPPEYYLYDGAYFVYEPRDYSAPYLRITALAPSAQQDQLLGENHAWALAHLRAQNVASQAQVGGGQGFEVTVVNSLPGPLSTMFGRDATTIRVTGRESISFAGESRRVSPYIASEQGRGQSLFPRLDMDQDLQVKLEGTIGGKVHVAVDHNSSAFGVDANRVNVWYEGYEDDIIRRIDLGGTNMAMPGSRLVAPPGFSQGVFGVKTDLRLAGLDLTVLAAKEETEAETRTLTPSGGSATVVPLEERNYVRNRFFFYELPDTTRFYYSYGLDPGSQDGNTPGQLIEQAAAPRFRVYIDDNNGFVESRNLLGYAVANLPAGLDTVAMNATFNSTPNTARWPTQDPGVNIYDPNYRVGHWRILQAGTDFGWVFFDANGKKLVLGLYLLNGSLNPDAALAVSFDDPQGKKVGSTDPEVKPKLRLLHHPDQDADFYGHPTSLLMMRHVYYLGTTGIQDLELSIETQVPGDLTPAAPDNLPQSTYLHMFGLDELDQANRPGPDGLFDTHRANLLDEDNGFLFMPGLRPFSPPEDIVVQRLITAGVPEDSASTDRERLFGSAEVVDSRLYTLKDTDQTLPTNHYRLLVTTRGTETQIVLQQDIIEGSDVVRLDGRTLVRGVDYDIEPVAGGKITFKGQVLNEISPSSRIEVSYAFRPLLGTGQATLLGMSGKYDFGPRGYLAALALWESRRSFSRQPQLGDEPSRNLVGDVNLNLRFQPGFLTRLADLLPFTRTNAASSIAMAAEVAVSKPDPNTKNTAFVEDMESSDTSDRVASSREAWSWAALPDPTAALVDTLNRIPTYYYNPTGRVKRGHLNPTLPEDEANDGLTVLELGFDRDQVTNLLTSEPFRAPLLWAGVESAFPGNGLDLSQTRTLEFWLNDGIADPTGRRGRMHIDFGDISEDFVFFPNNPNRPGGSLTSQPNFNREAETPFQFIATTDDMGWNGKQDDCPPPSSERYPRGSDCHRPDHFVPATGQYPFANGTELDNRYDSEDINGDGVWDTKNSFFRVDLDLADLTYIDPGTDISPTYANDPNIDPKLKPGFQGWRHYRIDFQSLLRDSLYEIVVGPGERPPQLTQVRYLRIWFDDPQAPADPAQQLWTLYNYQLFDFKFTGNQWLQLGVHGTDASRLDPQPFDEIYTVSVINNKENPEYTIPPDADLVDTAGVQAREQALRLVFDNLKPGHEMVAQKTNPLGRPTDYTLYNRMNFFTNLESDFADSVEVFFRMGSDSLNFYEVARPLLGVRGWQETIFDLRTLTDLKFPEDVGVPVDTLTLAGRPVVQVRRFVQDIANPSVTLKITRRGNPSLKQVSRHFVGVRHLRPASDLGAAPVSGDFWFNNVRLEDPKREVGTAQIYGVQGNVADVFDFNATLSTRDADFLGLRQRTGTGSDLYNFQNSYKIPDVSRLIPTLGLTIPLSYTLARDVSRPKFSTSSDTENNPERADEQRTESVRRGFGLSLQKKPSKFFLFKPTLDRLTFAYNESHTERRSFTSRDTSASWSQNLNYDLSPKARNIPLFFRQQLNLLPTNVKFGAQHQNSRSLIYTSSGSSGGSLQPRPVVSARSFNWNAAAAMRPLQMLNVQYSFNESRDYREAHPDNEEERVRLGSFDFGIPTGRGEGISLDLSPRLFQYSYSANYADRRTVQVEQTTGAPRPDVHQLLSGRTHRVNFDFKLHRRLASLFGGAPRPVVPPGSGEMPEGERQFGGAEEGAQPPPPQGGPGEPPPPQGEQQPPPSPGAPGRPPGQQAPPESLQAAPPPRRLPNPLRPLFRFIGGIDAVKVEASDSRSASYVGAPQEANYMYRFGFSTDTGIPGYSEPSPLNTTRTLNLNTAVPLRGALRVTLRYGLRANDIESRSGQDALLRMNVDSSRETNFPSAELSINDLQKLRIFGSKLQRSTLTMGYNRTASERFSQDTDAVGTETQSNRRESSTTLITANWTGQWSGGTATTLALNQTSGEEETVGQRTTNTRRAITGTMRFKVAPKGGLRLPFIGALKTGLDVQLNGSYNRDSGKLFNNPNDPSVSIPQRQTSAIAAGARGDFTLSRSMTSGVELGYTRSRDEKNNQTVSTFRLGFNLTFLF